MSEVADDLDDDDDDVGDMPADMGPIDLKEAERAAMLEAQLSWEAMGYDPEDFTMAVRPRACAREYARASIAWASHTPFPPRDCLVCAGVHAQAA